MIVVNFSEAQNEQSQMTEDQVQTLKKQKLTEIQKLRQKTPNTNDL